MSTFALPVGLAPDPVTLAVWQVINRRRQPECWDSNEAIAARIGRSVRTVQLALRRLKLAGLVRVVLVRSRTGPGSASGRRIILGSGDLGAADCAAPAQPIAPRSDLPPDPPIEVSEDGLELEIDDDNPADRSTVPDPTTPPVRSSSCRPDSPGGDPEQRRATPEEVARLKATAESVFGPGIVARTRIKAFAHRWSYRWTMAALGECRKARARDGRVGWGYLRRTLESFAEEGGPGPTAEELAEAARAEKERKRAALRRVIEECRSRGV